MNNYGQIPVVGGGAETGSQPLSPAPPFEPDFQHLLEFEEGPHQVVVALGGIPFLVRSNDAGVVGFFTSEYGPFQTEATPWVTLDLRRSAKFPFATDIARFLTARRGTVQHAKFRNMAATVDLKRAAARGWVTGDNLRQDLSNVLRFVVGSVTPSLGALLFHTAALAHDGRAYLFFGPSTAGKSTVVKLSEDREVMTDDMLIVREDQGRVVASTCGFWGGETRCYPSRRAEYPIAGFFRLVKDRTNRLIPMDASRGAFEIACNVPAVTRTSVENQAVLEVAARAAAATPSWFLHFHNRDASFWRCLDDLA